VLARLQAEGLVDARPKRTATVAQPSLAEARDVFEVRRALEAEVVRLVIKRWKASFGAELEGLVREEDAAREKHQPKVWGRLAGEFHIKLARLSGNAVLERYMEELVTRCSLILAVYGRPHTHDDGTSEHAEIIAALRAGDANKAVSIMDHHMEVVERRAIAEEVPAETPALGDVLSRYVEAISMPKSATPIRRKARPQ
jgi:DNA-binding GntR family transcriptional regulator